MTVSDSNSLLVVTHEACLEHDPGERHPEHPSRLRAVLDALGQIEGLIWSQAPPVSREAIALVHDPDLVEGLLATQPQEGRAFLDGDTVMSPGSVDAAYRAAGAVCHAVDQVMTGSARRAFCAVRPPGHHAEPNRAMGFCLLNNIAIGASHAVANYELDRVAVVDFDVHHGNGTQAVFEQVPKVLFVSTHQWPLYPGTGGAEETGLGNILNVPLPAGTDSAAYRSAYHRVIGPALTAFDPQLLLISAGFDGHRDDPLANFALETADYAWITEELVKVAETHCDGRIVSTLEGGYNLAALADSTAAHVRALQRA